MSANIGKKQVLRPKKVFDPNKAGFEHPQPFSQGVISPQGRLVVVAGQVALDLKGKVIGKGNPASANTAFIFSNAARV